MSKKPKDNGRPLTEIDWDEFDKLCGMLCTQVEIADWFGCTDDTIQAAVRKKHGIGFSELYKRKSVKGKIALRRAQFRNATENLNPTMQVWLGKQYLGQRDQIVDDNKKAPLPLVDYK